MEVGMPEPMESAKWWLSSAELNMKAKIYAPALYSMEMAVEIAFKAVLISVHVDVQKVHDIRKIIGMFLVGNNALPRSFSEEIDEFLKTFERLLEMRSGVGYGFEGKVTMEGIKRQAEELFPKCAKIVLECEKAVDHLNRKK